MSDSPSSEFDAIIGQLRRDATQAPSQTAVVLGAFALVHAGTSAFLEAVRRDYANVYAGILADPENLEPGIQDAGELLRPDERRRILQAMEATTGVAILQDDDALQSWVDAAGPSSKWFCNASENDIGKGALERLEKAQIQIQSLTPTIPLTTGDMLKRMRR